MDEKVTFYDTLMKTANKNASEINDTNTNGVRELSLIEETINKNWNDKKGNNAVSNLKLFQQKQKTENNLLFNYKKALEKATNNASKVGEQINISISNVDTQIEKAKASISSPVQSAANTLNQAAGLAPKFAGEINSAISELQTATASMGQLGKNIKITIEDIRTLEQDLSIDLETININNSGYDAIDFSKVSTSIDRSQREEYVKISEKTREKYWKDCELKETNEPGIYLAIKDGIALGYVKIKDNTKVTTETKIEDKNETNATIKENQNQKENAFSRIPEDEEKKAKVKNSKPTLGATKVEEKEQVKEETSIVDETPNLTGEQQIQKYKDNNNLSVEEVGYKTLDLSKIAKTPESACLHKFDEPVDCNNVDLSKVKVYEVCNVNSQTTKDSFYVIIDDKDQVIGYGDYKTINEGNSYEYIRG